MRPLRVVPLCVLLAAPLLAFSQEPEAAGTPPGEAGKKNDGASAFAGLALRSLGPALISGRIESLAVDPENRAHYYVGVASGGVWKTTNDGATWTPVFDHEGSYSIGTVALDPRNPSVVWVGTGENNSQRSVGYGDGVYRSDDGSHSWKNTGLKHSEHIARILIDPRNSDVIYVASQGPLWGPGGDRGLFKSTDGGKNWKNILSISENTGVTDVVMQPDNADVLYAAAYQRRRHVWTLIDGGPESAIYKSTDAGATWTKLKSGLPTVDLGRIGLAVSPTNPDLVYAIVEAAERKGGIFRSSDRGATWERRNEYEAGEMYYATLFVDPKNEDRIYVMGTNIQVSDDGGKTLHVLNTRSKHVDNHVIWIDPNDTHYYLVGCDGGLYESFDRGDNWTFKSNLPLGQYYDVAVDHNAPFYYVYGGTQDNDSEGGPSRTRSASGIVNSDWFITAGGDGFRSQIDPDDPNTVYAESQNGGLIRYDRRTGERLDIVPAEMPGAPPLRWNWDSPILISPHSHTRLYFGANILFRSDDRGDSWRAISGDLTRQIDRNSLPVMGRVWGPEAVAKNQSTAFYGNTTVIAESPAKEGLIYVGTDDGLINVTEDGGANWRKIETFPGVPERTYVSRILASRHDASTVYAAFDNHKIEDFKPYLLKSTDAGRTWTPLQSNLPENGAVLALAEDPGDANLLFVGTEFGFYFSNDGGRKWTRLRGGLPTIAVRDLAVQPQMNDVVLATFGRGFYVLDDYTALRQATPETLAKPTGLFPVRDALMYIPAAPLGGRGKATQGEGFFTAPNPPFGATFTYYLKEAAKTQKERRIEAEHEAEKTSKALPYPTLKELDEEAQEEAPAMVMTVKDASGNVVRRLEGPVTAGMHRVTWDLRFPAPTLAPPRPPGSEEEEDFRRPPEGPLVMPGAYTVTLAERVNSVATVVGDPQTFHVVEDGVQQMSTEDKAALIAFQQKAARLQGAVAGALDVANTTETRLDQIQRALDQTLAADPKLRDTARDLHHRLDEILVALRGDPVARQHEVNTPPSISQRVGEVAGSGRMSTARPTGTQLSNYQYASEQFAPALAKLRNLVDVDLTNLEKALDAAGAPHTPGRIPDWKPE
ncbi:MAG TPA: glycosyl hydrolase [Terriglobia bacterium]|nr:glycosyl hydrolase [Terriglobia bacterium]